MKDRSKCPKIQIQVTCTGDITEIIKYLKAGAGDDFYASVPPVRPLSDSSHAHRVGGFFAALPLGDQNFINNSFLSSDGTITVIVSTTAFGRGSNAERNNYLVVLF